MQKVLAVTAGRKSGNSEILAKEVLMIAEEHGAEGLTFAGTDFIS